MAFASIHPTLSGRFAELTARRLQHDRDVTREVRSSLQSRLAPHEVCEAVFTRGTLVVRCRSASVASTLYFQRTILQRVLSNALGVRVSHVRFRT